MTMEVGMEGEKRKGRGWMMRRNARFVRDLYSFLHDGGRMPWRHPGKGFVSSGKQQPPEFQIEGRRPTETGKAQSLELVSTPRPSS